MTSVIGLDIGQAGSKIGAARNRGIDVLVNEVSNRATPSLVAFGPRSRMIGETAKTQETSNFRNTVGSLKRLIGRSITDEDIEIEKKFMSNELVQVGSTVGVKVQYLGEEANFSATQLYAMFLGQLRNTASKELKSAVNDCVIAVPVWYTEIQRRAVQDAAEIAGLNPLRLINDTTATALGYGITKIDLPAVDEPSRYIAFVDIGHSDYSVSIVAFNKGSLVVKGTAYDRHFGGRDLDYALVQHFAAEFKTKYKIDVLSNKKALFRLSASVEKLKKILSANAVAPLSVESIMEDIDASSSLTREDLEALIAPLLERTIAPLERALAEAGITKEQIEAVELVGGSTRVPSLKNRIEAFFDRPLSFTTNQDEAIARGATLACAMLSPVFKVREFTTTDTQLFPIKFVWDASVEDGDDAPELVAFARGNSVPSTKVLSFNRDSAFEVEARYADSQTLPGGVNPWIGKYTVKNLEKPVNGGKQLVKIRAKLNLSGILSFESATLYEDGPEEIVEVPVEVTDPAAVPVEGEEVVAPVVETKKVRKTIKTILKTIASSTSLDASVLNEYREKEGQMASTDKLVLETEDRKNALEEYVYDVREKLDGQWNKYVTDADKDALRSKLSEAEDWLYTEEGEDATKSAYVARLDNLKTGGDPIQLRYREHDSRPRATAALREVLSTFMDKAQSSEEKFAHIEEKEKNKVIEIIANAENWLGNLIARQAEREVSRAPVVTSEEILKKKDDIFAQVNPIMSKPAPKVKAETKKDEKKEVPTPETTTPDVGTPMEEDNVIEEPTATVEEIVPEQMETDDID